MHELDGITMLLKKCNKDGISSTVQESAAASGATRFPNPV